MEYHKTFYIFPFIVSPKILTANYQQNKNMEFFPIYTLHLVQSTLFMMQDKISRDGTIRNFSRLNLDSRPLTVDTT